MSFVPAAIGRTIAHSTLLAQKNSPGVLLGAGIVGMVGSTALACRATLKMSTLMEETKERRDMVQTFQHEEYDEKDRQRDIALLYFQTGVKVARLYAPAVIVGGLSIAALTRSHGIMTQRNAALAAAYTAIEKGFNEYRARVVEKYGENQDRDFRYGVQQVEIQDPKDHRKKKIVNRVAPGDPSIYAKFFDQTSSRWSKVAEWNMIFLKAQQNWANDLLRSRGHVFLNEVYDMLGIERTQAGAVVGWILKRDGTTDNFVDFGVFNGDSMQARDFVNGLEGAILLDFNVDGLIYDKLGDVPKEALTWQRDR